MDLSVQTIWLSQKASPALKSLRAVFQELRNVHDTFNAIQGKNDTSFWYSERPHIGWLAAAVWLRGGIALEEFRTKRPQRQVLNPRAKRSGYFGRADLWFSFKKHRFDCEAKHCRVNLSRKTKASQTRATARTLKQLDSAERVVNYRKKNSESGRIIALCFVSAEIRRDLFPEEFQRRLRKWMDSLTESCDALVWIGVSTKHEPVKGDSNLCYPGVLLAIREIQVRAR